MIDGACALALASAVVAVETVRLAAAWTVGGLVVSVVVGFMLHVGRGDP